ncbi:TonB-dependent receptor [Novosphingobium profundi]|uniref:TonB-dependent receptor n=1 Tax=Novosphingobium profundi TaxID=1774954 RepID=UPI001BDB3762|nr:TonB-dependent receptor [Novosphingobium profundi]MBT0670117.1 TonB-dependent receptor [Novosphingobium profundi]
MKMGIENSASALTVALVLLTPQHALAQDVEMAGGGPVAEAQDSAAQPAPQQAGLQEIIVTAQRRAESAQDVPIAITAVTADALQAKGLTDVSQIGGQAPNVTLKNTAAFGGSSSILVSYIRGIGQNDFAFNLEPGVGIYVDGVYLARNIGANVDLLDLERVEVLKGPQGTLFGRNTIGGALNIVTRDPRDEFYATGEVTTGSYNRVDVRGAVDIPIVPGVITSSIAFSSKHRDGWQKRIAYAGPTDMNPIYLLATDGAYGGPENTNTDDNFAFPIQSGPRHSTSGGENKTSVRAKLLIEPTDDFRVRLIGDYLHVDQSAAPFSLVNVNQELYVALYNTCITGNEAVYSGVGALTGLGAGVANLCQSMRGNAASPAGTQPSLYDEAGQHLPYDNRYVITDKDGKINPDKSYATGANFDKVENWGINAQIEYDLTPDLQVKSITAYRNLDSDFGVDIGGAPFLTLSPSFETRERQFSQELQLSGLALNGAWNFVLGGYYFHEWGTLTDLVPFMSGLIQINSPDNEFDTKSYAVFTHNNIEIIPDKLGITLGARYTYENKNFTGAQRDENNFGGKVLLLPNFVYPNPDDVYRLYPLGRNTQTFENFSYRVGAEYHVDRNIMVYASYATAFKGGGWTTRLTAANFNTTTFEPLPAPTFGPEKAKTAEIGIKSQLLDRRVRLNVAAFSTNYDNIQLTFQNGSSPVTANGGNGKIQGVEAELNAALTDAWTLDASGGYLDAHYTSVKPGVPLTGDEAFVNTPEWTLQAGTAYRIETGAGTFTPRIDWNYATKIYNDEANTELLATGARSLFNGTLTWAENSGRFELQAGVTNIFDKRYIQSGYTNALAIYSATYSRPREWFLTLRYRH